MKAGQRNARIELQTPPATATGHDDSAWTTYATEWAHIKPGGAAESGGRDGQKLTITLPYRTDIEPLHRIKYGSRYIDVEWVENKGEWNRETVLQCEEPHARVSATLRSYTDVFDPATGSNTQTESDLSVKVTVTAYTAEEMDGSLIQQEDLRVLLPAWGLGGAPSVSSTLVFGGGEWSIKAVTPEYAHGQVRRYVLQVRQ